MHGNKNNNGIKTGSEVLDEREEAVNTIRVKTEQACPETPEKPEV